MKQGARNIRLMARVTFLVDIFPDNRLYGYCSFKLIANVSDIRKKMELLWRQNWNWLLEEIVRDTFNKTSRITPAE